MAFFDNIFSLIDIRSFSSMWFWLMLAVVWSTTSHFVLGVPFDMVTRARRKVEGAGDDLQLMVALQVRRRLGLMRIAGHWVLAGVSATLSGLFVLAFFYWSEFAQALFLLLFPVTIVAAFGLSLARRIEAETPDLVTLCRLLTRQRFWIQIFGVVSIFITSIFGLLRIVTTSVL